MGWALHRLVKAGHVTLQPITSPASSSASNNTLDGMVCAYVTKDAPLQELPHPSMAASKVMLVVIRGEMYSVLHGVGRFFFLPVHGCL